MFKVVKNQDNETQWLNKEYGIRDNREFSKYDSFSFGERLKHQSALFFRELAYSGKSFLKNTILSGCSLSKKYETLTSQKTHKQALVVFFHGLNGQSSVWNNHITQFEKLENHIDEFKVDLFAPNVPKKGHCTLEDPELILLYQKIGEWAKNNPGKPVVLFGQSNGSRIALQVETYLRDHAPATPVHVSLTGGVLYGTSTVSRVAEKISSKNLNRFGFGFLTPVACQELALGSPSSKSLLDRVRKPLADHVAPRSYRKYSAMVDSYIRETGSSLPLLTEVGQKGKKERDYLVPGYGHNSLVNAVTDEQVRKSFHWINKRNGLNDSKQRYRLEEQIHLRVNEGLGLLEVRDERPFFQKIKDASIASFKNLRGIGRKVVRGISARKIEFVTAKSVAKNSFVYSPQDLPWNLSTESKGLYLFIHGLHGLPTDWNLYLDDLKLNDPQSHILAPKVPLEGDCSLEIAAKPLLDVVRNYLQKFPGQPVTLVGTSNGGRIVSYIESHLESEVLGTSRLSVVSLAGVHYGTTNIDRADKAGLLPLARLDRTLADEFHFGSTPAKDYLNRWHQKQKIWNENGQTVRHLFYASTEDEQVNISSSLPYHKLAVSTHKIVHGESHISIVDGMHKNVLEWLQINR